MDEYEKMLEYGESPTCNLAMIDYAKSQVAINFSDSEYANQAYSQKYGKLENLDFVNNKCSNENDMKNSMEDFFASFTFSPNWLEVETPIAQNSQAQELEEVEEVQPAYNRKDVVTLLGELDEIEEKLNEINAKKWQLANLMKLHTAQ